MKIKILNEEFSICQLTDISKINFSDEFYFLTKTDEEISLVCKSSCVPSNVINCSGKWNAFRIDSKLDFSLVGILSNISALLAYNKISIFAISSYDTDYILTKTVDYKKAVKILRDNGYEILY